MKIRRGFVSNSSSSSFLVFLHKLPVSVQETHDVFLGPNSHEFDYYEYNFDATTVANRLHTDLHEAKLLEFDEALKVVSHGWVEGVEYGDHTATHGKPIEECRRIWAEREKEVKAQCEVILRKMMEENPDTVMLLVNYSDNLGDLEAAMEHGPLFDRVPHIRISHH